MYGLEKLIRDLTKIDSRSEDVGSKNRQDNRLKKTREATRDSTNIDSQSEDVGLRNRQEN